MNRRSFVTLLGSGLAALCLPQVEWIPSGPTSDLVVPSAGAVLTDIDQITAEMLRQMTQRLPDLRGVFVPGAYRLGDEGLTEWWNVGVASEKRLGGLSIERTITPAAYALAQKVRERDVRRFGALPTEIHNCEAAVASDERSGLAVRGMRMYDIAEDGWAYRFDVVGGRAAA